MPDTRDRANRAIRAAAGRPVDDYPEDEREPQVVVTNTGEVVNEDDLFPWERIDVSAMIRRAAGRMP